MRYNTKISLWTAAGLLLLAGAASADAPKSLEVTAADLAAAGVEGAVEVAPTDARFLPPVKYFRSGEKLSEADQKKDCGDCADLIAIYAVEAPQVPGWNAEKSQQFVKMGGRLQLRTYIPSSKRIITVTAVNEQTMRKISAHLVAKYR